MEFRQLKQALQINFLKLMKDETHLFEVEVDKDELWNLFLDSFPAGTNEVYKERREYDCSCCRSFVRNFGNVVVIKNKKTHTFWDLEVNDSTFQPVLNALSKYIKSKVVSNIYISKFNKIGTDKNFEKLESVVEWHHFYIELPNQFTDKSNRSVEEIQGSFRDIRNVFKRSLVEITEESVLTVLELISQNSLYKGEEWKSTLTEFLRYKQQYVKLKDAEKDNYAWEQSVKVGGVIGKIKNHSIGTLLVDISENMDLDEAVKRYEKITAPINYKRPKAIYTQKMVDDAKQTIIELGYENSLSRRYAKLDDITVNNILFSNRDSVKRIIGGDSVFDEMSKGVSTINSKKFSKVEEVTIDDFVINILPTAQELEVLFENKHASNMVSLIAPENKDSKTMFKWDNNFSWAYSGNITDSYVKQNVKNAGGNVEGVLRFSIQWNDSDVYDGNDLDAHCHEPNGNHIYYPVKRVEQKSSGMLDVDIIHPDKNVPAVENIIWTDINKMPKGTYNFVVHCFRHNGGKGGFRAEIEFDGQTYSFDYSVNIKDDQRVVVAEVMFDGVNFTIKEKLPSNVSSRKLWNLNTNQFVPASVVMYSPNYWDSQHGIGHRHYFFMLKDCLNPELPNGFFNEFLKEDLLKHKKVFEALGSKMSVKDTEDQLSGIGFSSTKRNELVIKVKGQIDRMLKIKF